MNQLKLYKYATRGLLFLNVAVLAFFLLTKPKPPHRIPANNFQAEVIEILSLNERQVTTFRALAKEHNEQLTALNEQQHQLLQPYFESLANPSISVDKSATLNQFQQLEREKIEVTYQHFEELKSILTKEQLLHFEKFIRRYIDVFLVDKEKKTPPPKDSE